MILDLCSPARGELKGPGELRSLSGELSGSDLEGAADGPTPYGSDHTRGELVRQVRVLAGWLAERDNVESRGFVSVL